MPERYLRTFLWIAVICSASLLRAASDETRPLNPALLGASWPAYWIASPTAPATSPGVFYFRRELTLTTVPEHFWVHISADNRFLLHVNGKYGAEGPARGDLFHWRFETVDLTPFLRTGRNILAATVWNFGEMSPVAQMSYRTGFLLQGDTEAEAVANTGKGWQVRQEPGRSAIGHNGVHGYYAAGPAERIDGRLLDWSWDQETVASSDWEPPRVLGPAAAREAPNAANAWELIQDPLPPMERRLVEAGKIVQAKGTPTTPESPAAPLNIQENSHLTLLLDSTVLQTGYPELNISGGRDANIHITYSEALYDAHGQKGNRNEIAERHIEGITDEFISGGGDNRSYQPLWWRTWRYLQIEISTKTEPLQLNSLRTWFSAYPFDEKATITADIARLDQIWNTGWRTARLCAHETYMDAPYWEQLQYVGDTRIQALISYVMTGDARLARQAIVNIDDSRIPEGITQSRYPSGLPQFIPPFSLLWVNMLHDYWMYVDDPALVEETLPHTRTVLDWYAAHLRSDGLMGTVKWWEFGDWTANYNFGVPPQEADGGSTFLTLQFIMALQAAADMEMQFGSPERVHNYQTMVKTASTALEAKSWDGEHGLYADTPAKNSWSQEANILAVMLVAPQAEQKAILSRLLGAKEHESTTVEGRRVPPMSEPSYYFRFYLHRALDHAGMGDVYISQLAPWYKMLDLGLSTWAETPEPARSDCHAWSASPNYDLLTIVAGIRPDAPRFKKVRIAPHLTGLHHLDVSLPHPKGMIHTVYNLKENRWTATMTLPPGIEGELTWNKQTWHLHEGTQVINLQ